MLNMLVEEVGHIKMMVRISGKQQLKHNAQLQPFTPLLCRYSGRHDLKYLNQFELLQSPSSMQGKRLYCGFYLNELSYRLMPLNEPLEAAFELYQHHLQRLQLGDELEWVLRSYEFELLNLLGFGIEFEYDAEGQAIAPQAHYQYVQELGFVVAEQGYAGAALHAIAALDFSADAVRRAAKQLSRQILRPLLGNRDLKSRELFITR